MQKRPGFVKCLVCLCAIRFPVAQLFLSLRFKNFVSALSPKVPQIRIERKYLIVDMHLKYKLENIEVKYINIFLIKNNIL